MNESDKRVRRHWLMLLLLSMLLATGNTYLQFRFDPNLNQFFPPVVRYIVTSLSLIVALIFGYISYHCIYKKPGTKLLSLYFVLTIVSLLATPYLYFTGKLVRPYYIPYFGLYVVVTQAMGLYGAVVSWKMRKVNKKLRALRAAAGS